MKYTLSDRSRRVSCDSVAFSGFANGGVRAPRTRRNTLRISIGATVSVLLRFRTTPALPRSQSYFSERGCSGDAGKKTAGFA